MADADEKARQEKIAAARKRVELLKKKRLKDADAKKEEPSLLSGETPRALASFQSGYGSSHEESGLGYDAGTSKKPTELFVTPDYHTDRIGKTGEMSPSAPSQSLAQQSKMRSMSFRAGASPIAGASTPRPFSPEGETAPDIYRKHVARIEELEKENKRLVREAADSEKRWKRAEEELSDLREAEGEGPGGNIAQKGEIERLRNELASLQRHNAQLQQQVSRGSGHHGHRLSLSSIAAPPPSELRAELDSKTATIELMEIEISKLKAAAELQETGALSEKKQVMALGEKLARSEAAAEQAQRELQDAKRNLERATENAVREGSERSSAETRVRILELELTGLKGIKAELERKLEGLEKKVSALTTLHREQESRLRALRKEKLEAENRALELGTRVEKLSGENTGAAAARGQVGGAGGLDDEGMDELEDEERQRLEKKINSLEHEVHELRSGAWISRRREMETMDPGFQEVDLVGVSGVSGEGHKKTSSGSIGGLISSGLHALAGVGGGEEKARGGDGNEHEDQYFGGGEDNVEDLDFDEDAFRQAREEEALRRLERVKELKRSLKHWQGWRLDLADSRRGGAEGIGDIFEV